MYIQYILINLWKKIIYNNRENYLVILIIQTNQKKCNGQFRIETI